MGVGVGALALEGSTVWAARGQAGTLTAVTGSRRTVLRVGGAPVSLAFAFGKIWVALRDANRIASVDPLTMAEVDGPSFFAPVKVVAAASRIWVLSLDSNSLYPVDPTARVVGEPIYAPVGNSVDMVLAGEELWVLGAAEGGVSPVNAGLERVVRSGFDLPGRLLSGLSGSADTLWLGEPGRHSLLRVATNSIAVSELPAPDGLRVISTAVGACGVWAAGQRGALAIVDPRTGRALSSPVHVGRSIAALAPLGEGVWVSDPADGSIVHVAIRPAGG